MKTQIRLSLTLQVGILLVYTLIVALFQLGDPLSALTGCLASLIPAAYFSYRMLRWADDDDAQRWLGYAYRSDVGKWVMTGVIFFVAFTSGYAWDPVIFFVGYLLAQMSGIFIPLIQKGTVSNGR